VLPAGGAIGVDAACERAGPMNIGSAARTASDKTTMLLATRAYGRPCNPLRERAINNGP
jgi:hypothetical protein